ISVSERSRPEASSSNHAFARATALSSAGSTFRGRSSPSVMMIRVSTPRRFILSGRKRDRLKMLLVRTPAREQGTWIPSVTDMPSSRRWTLSMTSVRQAILSASICNCRKEVRGRFESGSHVRRIDPGLLERFQQARAIAQHVPCSDGHRPFDLRRRQTPSFSIVIGGPVNEAFGDIIAIASTGLRRPLHVERLTICVEELSRQRTRNRPARSSASARRIPVEPLLHSFPEFSGKNRFVLPGMALLLVADLADVNWVGQQFV